MHQKYIVGVSAIVTAGATDDPRVLVLRHRYWSAAAWGLPGGYMRAGETPEQAIAREVLEETGLRICAVEQTGTSWGYRLRAEVRLIARVDDIETLRVDGAEVREARFVRPDDLPAGMLTSHRARVATWAAHPGPRH